MHSDLHSINTYSPHRAFIRTLIKLLPMAVMAMAALSLNSCHSSKQTTATPVSRPRPNAPSVKDIDVNSMTRAEKSLVKEATAWLGTPYKYGGNSRDGVDCSGFVYHVFRNSVDITLPRNSGKQHEYCRKISKKELATGDLVFFATTKGSSNVSHVGLYVGDGKMIHASTSRGVVCQNLSDDYYTRTFVSAGRIESFASINKTKKSGSSKQPKQSKPQSTPRDEKPASPKVESPVIVTPPPSDAPTVHIDELEVILQTEEPSQQTDRSPKPVPDIKPAKPDPVVADAPRSLPTAGASSADHPLTPVKTLDPVTAPANPEPAPDTNDARSAVLRNLPDLQ